jgi:hypothetical protein
MTKISFPKVDAETMNVIKNIATRQVDLGFYATNCCLTALLMAASNDNAEKVAELQGIHVKTVERRMMAVLNEISQNKGSKKMEIRRS